VLLPLPEARFKDPWKVRGAVKLTDPVLPPLLVVEAGANDSWRLQSWLTVYVPLAVTD